ncbi:hypothetical protein D3C75_1174140 [compost metagenome]
MHISIGPTASTFPYGMPQNCLPSGSLNFTRIGQVDFMMPPGIRQIAQQAVLRQIAVHFIHCSRLIIIAADM